MPWRGSEYDGEFPSLGWDIVDWIEETLTVPDGESQGQPLKLTNEQISFIARLYRIDPASGRRVYRRGVLVRPKGWGKSPFLAAVALAELVAPVVFDGWDTDGEPVGKPWATPWIQIASVSEDSTDNTWSALYQMAINGSLIDQAPGLDVGLTRIYLPGGGRCEPVTSSSGSREGQRITFAVPDETHLWVPSNGGVKLAATLRRNLAKMNGTSAETTNAPFLGEQSVAEATIEACRRGGAGARGILFDHREAPDVPDFGDTPALRKALTFVYGDSSWIDLDRLIDEIRDPDTEEQDARRFYLNQVRAAADRAFDVARWAELARPDVVVADKTPVVAGFDGSRFDDATALIGTVIATGHQFVMGLWERPQGADGEGWEVPADEAEAAMVELFDRFKVWRVYADPPYWEDTVAAWAGRFGNQKVVSWWTHRDRQVAFALRAYRQAMTTGELTHDGDSAMARHIGNAVRRRARARDEEGHPMWTIGKPARQSPYKIDAAMAGALSWEARRDAVAAGAVNTKPRGMVVYRR